MKNGFRILLLVIVMFALYSGLTTQAWSFPIGIVTLCCLCFLGTLKKTRNTNTAKTDKNSNTTPIIITSSITSNSSSSNTCSGFDGGSSGADGGC